MRILMQSRSFLPTIGGAEVRFYELARALAGLGHDVTIFAPEAVDPGHRDRWTEFRVVRYPLAPFFSQPARSYWASLWRPRREWQFSRAELAAMPSGPWDVAYTGVREFAVRLKRERPETPVFFAPGGTVFGLRAEYYPGSDRRLSLWGWRQRIVYRQAMACERTAARAADAVLAQSDLVARVFRDHYRVEPTKIRRVNHGVDLDRFRRAVDGRAAVGGPRSAVRRTLGVADDVFLVAFVGRLAPEKNLPFLLRALARPDVRTAHLTLVGDGPERRRLAGLADELGLSRRVVLAGLQRNVEDYLAAADLFVLPSTSESFGIALAEAMAAGLPTMALRPDFGRINTGVAEHIEDGVTGFLVDPDDPGDLAEKIGLLAADPARARAMGIAAREAAERKFHWPTIARQLIDLVEEVRRKPGRHNEL